jgi:hypothetical protein
MVMKNLVFSIIIAVFTLPVCGQVIKSSPAKSVEDLYCSGLFKSTDGTIIDLMEVETAGYINIFSYLQGRVSGYQVTIGRNGTIIPLLRGHVPAIFINEMPATAAGVNYLSVNDIAMVKVIKTPFYGSANGAYGAIAIYTVKAEEEEQ